MSLRIFPLLLSFTFSITADTNKIDKVSLNIPLSKPLSYEESIIKASDGIYKKWGSDNRNLKVIIIDFTIPLGKERLFVVDLKSHTIVKSSRVCHGVGSSRTSIPEKFSNEKNSKMSSKGIMKTAETYYGMWGYSMKVDGLEPGVNSNARDRAIVFHNSDLQKAFWSWGCFSMPGGDYKDVIDMTKNGTLIFVFSNKEELSKYL